MTKVDRRVGMVEFDEDATEGQMADYWAAEESGDPGEWATGIVDYVCKKCGVIVEYQRDELADYNELIANWHEKTNSGDYFSKYIFEYLAFMAFLKSHLSLGSVNERAAIQNLKLNINAKKRYLDSLKVGTQALDSWMSLIEELNREIKGDATLLIKGDATLFELRMIGFSHATDGPHYLSSNATSRHAAWESA